MVLRANTNAIINVPLHVGGTSEQVVVNAGGAELLSTASANNPTTLDETLLESLPNNTLQPLNFVFALAGTTEAQGGMTTRSGFLDPVMAASSEPARRRRSTKSSVAGISPARFACPVVCRSGSR